MNQVADQTANEALTRNLLDFWCRAHGCALKSMTDRIAVIDHGFGDTVWMVEDLVSAVRKSDSTVAADMTALRMLAGRTYEIRHNPNCPAPFELRAVGLGGLLDHDPAETTLNDVGYGRSISEAALSLSERIRRRENATIGQRHWAASPAARA